MKHEQASQLGVIQGEARIAVVEAAYGPDIALSYAAGMAASSRDYVMKICGPNAAYELCAEMGDQIVDHAFKLRTEQTGK